MDFNPQAYTCTRNSWLAKPREAPAPFNFLLKKQSTQSTRKNREISILIFADKTWDMTEKYTSVRDLKCECQVYLTVSALFSLIKQQRCLRTFMYIFLSTSWGSKRKYIYWSFCYTLDCVCIYLSFFVMTSRLVQFANVASKLQYNESFI